MFNIKVIFFDTETSGLDCSRCNIIELALLTVEDGVITETYYEFIDVGVPISRKISDLTGITNEMIKNEGIDEKSAALDLKQRLTPDTLMIAHNCQFDLQFLYSLLKRHFPQEADEIVSSLNWIDTVSILKDRKEFPHKLIDAVNYYEVPEVNFHRAIDDTKALYEVTKKMKEERDDLLDYVNVFGYNPKYGVSGKRFEFIEYKSQKFHQRIVAPEFTLPNKKF